MGLPGLLTLFAVATLPVSQGTYKPSQGDPARWSVNPNHVLIWNSTPYLPFGLRISANPEEIAAADAAGVQDVLVDCPPHPALLKSAVEALEKADLRYLLRIDSLSPSATGALIEPSGNRITGITAKRKLEFQIPGAEEALIVLAVRRDGAIHSSQRVKGAGGSFSVEVAPPNELEHVAMIYPLTSSLARLGAWESFDRHRDAVLASLKDAGFGKGLRGIVNPLGAFATPPGGRSFVPTGRLFRIEFAAYLKQRYRSPQTAMRSWAMSGTEEKTFDEIARLIPLWSGTKGVASLWDPRDNQLYGCDIRRSSLWRDLDAVLSTTEARRTERLIASIRRYADVPIVQEWSGWAPLYENDSHGLDGIGAFAAGTTVAAIADSAAKAASTLLRWRKSGWLLATHVDLTGAADAAAQLSPVLEDLVSMGVRGAYVRTADPALRAAIVQMASTKGSDMSLVQWSVKPFYYPESVTNPPASMRLPGGSWWLPTPEGGTRIEMGSQFFAYRINRNSGHAFALWSRIGKVRVRLDLAIPQGVRFQTVDGSNPQPKIVRNGVEVDIGELPLWITGVDEIPVPAPAYEEMIHRFGYLVAAADARQSDTTEERFLFRDYLNAYIRNPGGSFGLMNSVFQKLSSRLARYLWVEGESARSSNFSETAAEAGLSNGYALALKTQLLLGIGEYTAEYLVQPRTDEEVECWVAARMPRAARDTFRVVIGGQSLAIEGEPVSAYGSGYAWYPMGKTRMGRAQTKVALRVLAPEGTDLAIDSIMFFPGAFRPQGITQPDAVTFPPMSKR